MPASPQDPDSPPPDDLDRIERALGWRPTVFRPATVGRGPSANSAHWIAADHGEPAVGRGSAFVKIGATKWTADWLRTEYRNYRSLRGWFLPEVLGFDDDGERPVLALEDLSAADWPPPWTDERVAAVLDALAAIRGTPRPDHLIRHEGDGGVDWQVVAADPAPFLALGLCSTAWLDAALPALIAAAASAPLAGEALLHMDIRSDNLCFRAGRAIVLDWNHAAIANPDLEVAAWLPSLQAEGGPAPDTILPDAPGLAAWVTGYFCARAGEAPIDDAPHVRPLQIKQSRTALPWAARALGLPPP